MESSIRKLTVVCVTVGTAVILICVILFRISLYNYNYVKRIIEGGDNVYAVCTYKWSKSGTNRKIKTSSSKDYYADAVYTYNGQTYQCHKLSVNSNIKVGDEISIYILPEQPEKYVQSGQQKNFVTMLIFYGIMPFLGIMVILVPFYVRRQMKINGYNIFGR